MMMTLTLASWTTGILAALFVFFCLFFCLVIVVQKPKGGGLSGAFGGAGGSGQAVFGAKTGDVLTWVTVSGFVIFLLLAMALVYSTRNDWNQVPQQKPSEKPFNAAEQEPTDPQTPGTPKTPTPAPAGTPALKDDSTTTPASAPAPAPAPEPGATAPVVPAPTPTPAPTPGTAAPGPAPAPAPTAPPAAPAPAEHKP